jgi:hypothetical protein
MRQRGNYREEYAMNREQLSTSCESSGVVPRLAAKRINSLGKLAAD